VKGPLDGGRQALGRERKPGPEGHRKKGVTSGGLFYEGPCPTVKNKQRSPPGKRNIDHILTAVRS